MPILPKFVFVVTLGDIVGLIVFTIALIVGGIWLYVEWRHGSR